MTLYELTKKNQEQIKSAHAEGALSATWKEVCMTLYSLLKKEKELVLAKAIAVMVKENALDNRVLKRHKAIMDMKYKQNINLYSIIEFYDALIDFSK